MSRCEAPNFSVYWSAGDPNTLANISPVSPANTVRVNVNSPLYRDPYLQTAFPGERLGLNENVFLNDVGANLHGRVTLFLHDGALSFLTLGPAVAPGYGLPVGTYTFAIDSGTGAFLNAKGVVVQTVAASGLRSICVVLGAKGPNGGR